LPGVAASGGVTSLPLSGYFAWGPLTVEGRAPLPGEQFINADPPSKKELDALEKHIRKSLKPTLQQIRDAKLRSSNALRTNAKEKPGFSAGFRAQSVLFIQSLQCGRPWPPPRGPAIPPPPPGAAM